MPHGRADIAPVAAAFEARRATEKALHNTASDGDRYLYHENVIAEHREDGLYVTLADYPTVTTLHRLSALTGVDAAFVRNVVRLNGVPWDGEWVRVKDQDGHPVPTPSSDNPAVRESIWNPDGFRARNMRVR